MKITRIEDLHCDAGWRFQVERDATLIAVQVLEIWAVPRTA